MAQQLGTGTRGTQRMRMRMSSTHTHTRDTQSCFRVHLSLAVCVFDMSSDAARVRVVCRCSSCHDIASVVASGSFLVDECFSRCELCALCALCVHDIASHRIAWYPSRASRARDPNMCGHAQYSRRDVYMASWTRDGIMCHVLCWSASVPCRRRHVSM